jgi:SAM-dependent methyltransferase
VTRAPVVPDRVRWAADHLDPAEDACLLEVGCGPGAAAQLLCERLGSGRLLAVDRSATAVRRTASRNAGHVAAGRLTVVASPVADLGPWAGPPGSFDDAFAVDVNVFWLGSAAAELAALLPLVRSGGGVHLVYGTAGPSSGSRVVDGAATALRGAGVTEVEVTWGEAAFAVCGRRPGPGLASAAAG